MRVPAVRELRSRVKDPILLGEALGSNPSNPLPMGDEAFIQDHLRGHLRGVAEAVAADLRKIATLPDKLTDGQAGTPVAWALLAKNSTTQGGPPTESPSRVRCKSFASSCKKHCTPLSDNACTPFISAEQWEVARLPIQAGGLYLGSVPLEEPLVPLTGGSVPLTGLFSWLSCRLKAWCCICQGFGCL